MPKSNEQSLDDFCKEMAKDIEDFKTWWVKNQTKKPEHWPTTMGRGDWWEQFLAYETTDGS